MFYYIFYDVIIFLIYLNQNSTFLIFSFYIMFDLFMFSNICALNTLFFIWSVHIRFDLFIYGYYLHAYLVYFLTHLIKILHPPTCGTHTKISRIASVKWSQTMAQTCVSKINTIWGLKQPTTTHVKKSTRKANKFGSSSVTKFTSNGGPSKASNNFTTMPRLQRSTRTLIT